MQPHPISSHAPETAEPELFAVANHELRTPTRAVLTMAELLLRSQLDGTQRRYLETLHESALSLLAGLNDILDFANLESGRIELEPAIFDLHDLLRAAAAELEKGARSQGFASSFWMSPDCPRYVRQDEKRIRQVLACLIDNALKFTHSGSVSLHASARAVNGKVLLRFEVSDTGSGLTEAERGLLFRPRVKGHRAVLGLAIAKRLVELMSGEIGCESAKGEGSLFWFTVMAERAQPSRDTTSKSGSLRGHILVAEDNAMNRMLIGTYLDEFGLTCDMVTEPAALLQHVSEGDYHLLLLDVGMRGLDGIATVRQLRDTAGPGAELPILALLQESDADREAYLAAGVDDFVPKPIRGRDLYAALAANLSGHGSEEGQSLAAG